MLSGSLALAHIDVHCDRVGMVATSPATLPDREMLDGIARSLSRLLPGPSALRAAVN
jgi:hypothetical protein